MTSRKKKLPTSKRISDMQAFAGVYNNRKSFPDIEALASELSTTAGAVQRRAASYAKLRDDFPELKLPKLVARKTGGNASDDVAADTLKLESNGLTAVVPDGRRQVFVITSAQGGAAYNKALFKSLQGYAEARGGRLIVTKAKYFKPYGWKNRVSKVEDEKHMRRNFKPYLPEGWETQLEILEPQIHADLRPYLVDADLQINRNLLLNVSMDILATATRPLSGLTPSSDLTSQIFPHPKLELDFVARSSSAKMPKAMMTTGSVTYPNYRPGKAGKKAARDHCFGAIVVEVIDKDRFLFRQLLANKQGVFHDIVPKQLPDGSWTTVPVRFSPDGAQEIDSVDTIIYGDWHVTQTSQRVRKLVLGDNGMVACLKPRRQVFHDFVDGYAISHHHEGDPMLKAEKRAKGNDSLEWEFNEGVKEVNYIRERSPHTQEFVFVASNHNEHPARYLRESRYIKDPVNYYFAHRLVPWQKDGAVCPFSYYLATQTNMDRLRFLSRDEDYVRYGIKLDLHGDQGANGARGTLPHLAGISLRCVIGHNHRGGIRDLVWSVGTSTTLKLEYTSGPTSWTNTHCIVYPGGQRQLVVMVEDFWSAACKL